MPMPEHVIEPETIPEVKGAPESEPEIPSRREELWFPRTPDGEREEGSWRRCPGCGTPVGNEHADGCAYVEGRIDNQGRQIEDEPLQVPWEPLVGKSDVRDLRQWQVENLWHERELGFVWGPPGSFKSLFLQHAANCIATGKPVAGHSVKRAGVLYVAAEDPEQYDARQRAWELTYNDGEPTKNLRIMREPVDLLEVADETLQITNRSPRSNYLAAGELGRIIEEYNLTGTSSAEERIELVIFDSLERCMPNASDVSDKDMGLVIDRCIELTKSGLAVVLVHHGNVAGTRERGHGSLGAAINFRYRADRTGEGLKLKRTKMRNGELNMEIVLAPQAVDIGASEPSVVLKDIERQQIDDTDEKLLEAAEGGAATLDEYAEIVGLHKSNTSRRLRKLVRLGELQRDGNNWRLPDDE